MLGPKWILRRARRSEIVALSLSCYVMLANSFPSSDGFCLKWRHRIRWARPQIAICGECLFRITAMQQQQQQQQKFGRSFTETFGERLETQSPALSRFISQKTSQNLEAVSVFCESIKGKSYWWHFVKLFHCVPAVIWLSVISLHVFQDPCGKCWGSRLRTFPATWFWDMAAHVSSRDQSSQEDSSSMQETARTSALGTVFSFTKS